MAINKRWIFTHQDKLNLKIQETCLRSVNGLIEDGYWPT